MLTTKKVSVVETWSDHGCGVAILSSVCFLGVTFAIANFTYENQKLEREKSRDVSASLAAFQANWPCVWGEAVTGYMPTWEKQWDRFKDGWKFTCGLQRIAAPCVIYSLGSAGNMAFEKGVLEDNAACTIYIYDQNQHGIDQWFSEDVIRAKRSISIDTLLVPVKTPKPIHLCAS
jgi:hypothetical protein